MDKPPPYTSSSSTGPKTLEDMKSVPDFEEGPHSQIGEDEFYDAVENALDKLVEEQQCYDNLKKISIVTEKTAEDDPDMLANRKHPLWPVIDNVSIAQGWRVNRDSTVHDIRLRSQRSNFITLGFCRVRMEFGNFLPRMER